MSIPFQFLHRAVFGPKVEWLAHSGALGPWAKPSSCVDWLWDTLPPYAPLPEFKPELMVPEDLAEQQRLMQEADSFVLYNRILTPMVELDNPIRERVALFWHHHMPTTKGRTVEHGIHHWEIYRRYGLGNLRDLLLETLSSPAMMRFLDLRYSRKQNPNENFSREFLELHTLGEGHYTLEDVKEAARAMTGYGYKAEPPFDRILDPAMHDEGIKNIFGHQGNFDVEDIVDLVLERPQTARHIAGSALRFFCSDDPPEEMIEDCAKAFLDSAYDMKTLLEAMFRHPNFKGTSLGTRVKTPIELLVSFQRQLGLRTVGLKTNWHFLVQCGQLFFDPPSVAGWPGGDTWLQGDRLLHRLFLPSAMLDIANRSMPRGSLVYKVSSRWLKAEKRGYRYLADARWDEDAYRKALARHGLAESEWLLGENAALAATRDILQDSRYQHC